MKLVEFKSLLILFIFSLTFIVFFVSNSAKIFENPFLFSSFNSRGDSENEQINRKYLIYSCEKTSNGDCGGWGDRLVNNFLVNV